MGINRMFYYVFLIINHERILLTKVILVRILWLYFIT